MKKIYTRTGDGGLTGLRGGVRVPKDDIRIETNGIIDELNALIGICRSMLLADDEWQPMLYDIQTELMTVMSHIATPEGKMNPRELHVRELTERMEKAMDELNASAESSKYFILPGGTTLSAHLQFARTIARTAERRLWTLNRQQAVNKDILCFMNRLSDYLFSLSRAEMQRKGFQSEPFVR